MELLTPKKIKKYPKLSVEPEYQDYAELHCITNFSFLRGVSFPEEIVERANELGYRAIAITDECSVSGIVRAHMAAKNFSIKLIIGSEFILIDGCHLVLLAENKRGYSQICNVITHARRQAKKGSYSIDKVTIKDILINKNNVSIKVLFESDQIKVLKDQKNTVIDGNLRKVIKVKDIWMFDRNFTLKNKNWTLVETSTE